MFKKILKIFGIIIVAGVVIFLASRILVPKVYMLYLKTTSCRGIVASDIRVKVYDANGQAISKEELTPKFYDTGATTGVFSLDKDYNPAICGIASIEDGQITLSQPVPQPLILQFFPKVEGFGQVRVFADNGGSGYTLSSGTIDLPLEAVRSRILKVEEVLRKYPVNIFRKETMDYYASAKNHLQKALTSSAPDSKEIYLALHDALWAGEGVTLDAAKSDIERNGRRPFLFGGFLSPEFEKWGEKEKSAFSSLFNFATLKTFYLRGYEQEEGQPQPQQTEAQLAWLKEKNIPAKGHPLVYMVAPNIPSWLKGGGEEIFEAMRTRILREVGKFKGQIKVWDTINEASNPNWGTQKDMVELTRLANNTTKEADPQAVRVVNINNPTGNLVGVPMFSKFVKENKLQTAFQYMKEVQKAGIDYDITGIQIYYDSLDLMEYSRLLDRYAALGKPIHISEVGVSSAPGVDKQSQYFQNASANAALGQWHGPWSEKIQADWIEQFYTMAYAKPYIKAITWLDLSDDFWPYAGLLHRDGTPKEGYTRLKNLLQSWGFASSQ
ncbi:MAG: endo-1,4-beta-xylanase [bacterium]|nr:endo-1,4-beta-xylanase [bacterium]